jgi:hypothetical protein
MRKKTEEEIYMRKDEKREIFDAVLTKALGIDYSEFLVSLSGSCKLPKNFPGEYGVRLYNEGIPSQSYKLLPSGIFSAEELERIKRDYESYLAVFREMTDKAISGQRPSEEDIKILEEIILQKKKIKIESYLDKGNPHFYPSLHICIPPGRALAFYWVYWTWIKHISVRRCIAEDCSKIFIPVRLDHLFCSKRCAKRVWAQRQ